MTTFYRISKLAITPDVINTRVVGEVQKSDSDSGPWIKIVTFDQNVSTTADTERMKRDILDIATEISLRDITEVKVVTQVIADLDDQVFVVDN